MHLLIAQDVLCTYFVTEDVQLLKTADSLKAKGALGVDLQVVSLPRIMEILEDLRKSESSITFGQCI